MPSSRWDSFAVGELESIAEGIQASFSSSGVVDVPLWRELLAVMDARGAATAEVRDEMRQSIERARVPEARQMRIRPVERQMPPGSIGKGSW